MPAVFFAPNHPNSCCLCGSSERLTGEHKVKRTALDWEFGAAKMAIGSFGDGASKFRYAQGPKSKAFHFSHKLCSRCNGARTQPADREFDRMHSRARELAEAGKDTAEVLSGDRYQPGSEPYLNVFRYFAKVLCCHIAEAGAPRPIHMSRFAIGEAYQNCIWLRIDRDWTYHQLAENSGMSHDIQYAAHGGLIVYGERKTGAPNAFHSTLTFGPLRYVFWSRLNWFEKISLRFSYPEFFEWCRDHVRRAAEDPISEDELRHLGL